MVITLQYKTKQAHAFDICLFYLAGHYLIEATAAFTPSA